MPRYDYRCEQNGQVIEVSHKMSEKLTTWGELCEKAGMEPGDTPAEAPITRLISKTTVLPSDVVNMKM